MADETNDRAHTRATVTDVLGAIDAAGFDIVEYRWNDKGGKDACPVGHERAADEIAAELEVDHD